jgi:hypothetical protein
MTNHPKTRKDAVPQKAPKKFLLLSERNAPNAAKIVIRVRIITSPMY